MNLFGEDKIDDSASFTLADRMRPRVLDEIVGQDKLIGAGTPLRAAIENKRISSMVFWGPPGCGKTTLARVIANETGIRFLSYSAVLSGIKEIKNVIKLAEQRLANSGDRSILFIDEVHRFNKAQQDAFLPYVERGSIIFVGATTENPSFEIISPLLSRLTVFVLEPLRPENIVELLQRAISDKERGLGAMELTVEDGVIEKIAQLSAGDARFALSTLEVSANTAPDGLISESFVAQVLQRERLLYDKNGEEHYNLISALHKSVRDSDPDAAIYWLARMLEAGEDALYIVRRMMRMAVEDIGLADPSAIRHAISAKEFYQFLGSPEGDIALFQLAVYLAIAPKSNSIYIAQKRAVRDIRDGKTGPVPMVIRNAPTRLMKELGYGTGYKYAHDFEEHLTKNQHFPDGIEPPTYYEPSDQGVEERIRKRLGEIERELRKRREE
ncbi:MAG TPA: replication-associated recombination protein A [candidate division Zixibacteria bacterium]|nr:replication-associated recombination protein A [candidate division Zixibacteria bacterium]